MSSCKKIIVCDSGLGGVSVAANLILQNVSQNCEPKDNYEIIYFNAFPDLQFGYNDLPTLYDREKMFRNVLEAMENFNPEVCIIACNTLSIIYNSLSSWYKPNFPVLGIVETATDAMIQFLLGKKENKVVILGTKTTVESCVYQDLLLKNNIEKNRIFQLACPNLAKNIERVPNSLEIREQITSYCKTIAQMDINSHTALVFCCTHYGYVKEIWEEEFFRATKLNCTIINPNDYFKFSGNFINFSFHSRIPLSNETKNTFTNMYKLKAPLIANALQNAVVNKKLFNIGI